MNHSILYFLGLLKAFRTVKQIMIFTTCLSYKIFFKLRQRETKRQPVAGQGGGQAGNLCEQGRSRQTCGQR